MVFSSAVFLYVFLPVCLIGYYLMPKLQLKNYFLLIMSLMFYGYGEPQFVYLMLFSIFVNWGFGMAIDRKRTHKTFGKTMVALMAFYNLGIFFVYKYLNFVIVNADSIFGLHWETKVIYLPIGISFFTFQAMSYVIDVYRGTAEVQKNPFNTALYICLFPQMIAGPIVRYSTFAGQLTDRKFHIEDFTYGIKRFIIGLSKKLIIANMLANVADQAFNQPVSGNITILMAWLGIICYTMQIYFDFSGYSDMAIGLGRMFGFRFSENFNHPYISKTVSEFWRRWHISLSSWFRDYVYFPMGGSRVAHKGRLVFNLFVVWMLTGIWHGADWSFVFWGFFYFILLTFEKLSGIAKKIADHKVLSFFYRIFTILCFMIGWVIFRASSLTEAVKYTCAMFGIARRQIPLFDEQAIFFLQDNLLLIIIAIICCLPITEWISKRLAGKKTLETAVHVIGNIVLMILFLVCAAFVVNSDYNPFIYTNF